MPKLLTSRTAFALSTLAVAGLGFGVWHWSSEEPRRQCVFEPGFTASYELSGRVKITTSLDGLFPIEGAGLVASHISLQGRLQLRALAPDKADHGLLVAKLADLELRRADGRGDKTQLARLQPESYTPHLEKPFLLRVASDCRLVGFARGRDTQKGPAREVQTLVQALNFRLPPVEATQRGAQAGARGSVGLRYRDIESDGFGKAEVVYRYETSCTDCPPGGAVTRRRVSYVPERREGPSVVIEVVRSERTVKLGEGPWFSSLDSLESTRGRQAGKELMNVQSETNVRWLSRDVRDVPLRIDSEAFVWMPWQEGPRAGHDDPKRQLAKRGVPFADAWAQYKQGVSSSVEGQRMAAFDNLMIQFRANPEQAKLIHPKLAEGALNEHESAAVIAALAEAGTDAGRHAVMRIASDVSLPEGPRMQAAVALGDLKAPDRASVKLMARLAVREEGTKSEKDLVGNASMMALGTLISTRTRTHPEAAAVARKALREAVASERFMIRRDALVALGNTDDGDFLPLIEQASRDDSERIRAAAAKGLAGMPVTRAASLVIDWLAREGDAKTAAFVIDAHHRASKRQKLPLSDEVVTKLMTVLEAKPARVVRAATVDALGARAKRGRNEVDRRAKRALADQFAREPDSYVRQKIGQYLTAAELMEARDRAK